MIFTCPPFFSYVARVHFFVFVLLIFSIYRDCCVCLVRSLRARIVVYSHCNAKILVVTFLSYFFFHGSMCGFFFFCEHLNGHARSTIILVFRRQPSEPPILYCFRETRCMCYTTWTRPLLLNKVTHNMGNLCVRLNMFVEPCSRV